MKGAFRYQAVLGLLVGLTAVGCGSPWRTEVVEEAAPDSTQRVRRTLRGQMLQDAQQQVQVRLQSGWEPAPRRTLHDSAELYAQNAEKDLYFLVVSEDENSVDYYGLDDNAFEYRQLLVNALDSGATETRTEVTQFNTYPAVQYEIQGSLDGTEITYLHTTVATDDRYYQVVGWTEAGNFAEHRQELESIITSFREI